MSLINQIRLAVENGDLNEEFITADVIEWVEKCEIRKEDGAQYAISSVNSISSNSDIKNALTTNENKKILISRKGENDTKIYSFPILEEY